MRLKSPPAPEGLLSESASYWRQIHREFRFTQTESGIVRTLIRAYDAALRALEDIQAKGATIPSGNGGEKRNPSLEIYKSASSVYLQSSRLLGLKPKQR